jgi:hypothetical protein
MDVIEDYDKENRRCFLNLTSEVKNSKNKTRQIFGTLFQEDRNPSAKKVEIEETREKVNFRSLLEERRKASRQRGRQAFGLVNLSQVSRSFNLESTNLEGKIQINLKRENSKFVKRIFKIQKIQEKKTAKEIPNSQEVKVQISKKKKQGEVESP